MKFKIVACGVFEPYLSHLASEAPHDIDIECLDAGLHARPHDLRLMLQAEIDETSRVGGYDVVILFYGLCGRGTANLIARNIPVIIPRAHDCISLFLGSNEAYLKQFHKHPGTFYHSLGWIKKKINPKDREASELYHNYEKVGYEKHPEFDEMQARFGSDNATHILAFFDRWKQHYTRGAYISMGFPEEDALAQFTQQMADVFGWEHEVLAGDAELMRDMLAGNWCDSRVMVLQPENRSISTGDDRILGSVAYDAGDSYEALSSSEVIIESGNDSPQSVGIGLGIDAGGTYTDAVIYDIGLRKLLAKAKALTTYHNLVEGIGNALTQLPSELLAQVQVTSLSTTLATNSIVEGRGHKVGLIAVCPWDWTEEQVGHQPLVNIPGGVSITGEIVRPLDEVACRKAIRRLVEKEHCAVLVVAGYATVRNPEQANRVREIAQEMCDVQVICAHEVSRRINGIHAAQTAVANAKLLPVIRQLIDSVHKAMADFHIPGRLMVVKGDGSPVDESVARARPVETILSGPAASVNGARILTGLDNALIMDIGGTTTDCAILQDGHVAVSPDGARVGSWVMSVDAVEISTVGLGGDSRIDFTNDRRITIGPVRNIPFAYLAHEHESVLEFLQKFDARRHLGAYDASAMDVLVPGAISHADLVSASDHECDVIKLLEHGPISAQEAARTLGLASPVLLPLSRLEQCGMVKRAGLTPTDLLHVTGKFARWSTKAATLALEIFAAMYGRSKDEVLEMALGAVTRRLFEEIVRREVSFEDGSMHELPEAWNFLLDKAFLGTGGLGVKMSLTRPVVAIGAPAQALVPQVAEHIAASIIIPENADVANAIGAIGSEVVAVEEILIRPGETSNYVLHGTNERLDFSELGRATEKAVEISKARARQHAIEAGAVAPEVTITRSDRLGSVSGGGSVFLERRVVAIASGCAFGVDSACPQV